MIYKRS